MTIEGTTTLVRAAIQHRHALLAAVIACVLAGLALACRDDQVSPPTHTESVPVAESVFSAKEVAEIKAEALRYGKQFVLSDAEINARYVPPKPCKQGDTDSLYTCPEEKVIAVAQVRGVQLIPGGNRNTCRVKFDYVTSRNPKARLPATEVVAERFETETSHYWVIGPK